MKSLPISKEEKRQQSVKENGRAIAQGMHEIKVEQKKNMAKAEKRAGTMLERAASKFLDGRM